MCTKVNDFSLTPKQERFVAEYLQTGNLTQSAEKVGVSKGAVYKWLNRGLADVISERQKQVVELAVKTMQTATLKATQFLLEVMQNDKNSISDRLKAADLLTRNGLKAYEQNQTELLADIEMKLEELTK